MEKVIFALPTYEAIQAMLQRFRQRKVPMKDWSFDDAGDAIYYTESFDSLCNNEVAKKKILRIVGKNKWHLLSKFHREIHPDPQCPYTIQSQNYRSILNSHFSAIFTTINRVAFINSSLYVREIYIIPNDDFLDDSVWWPKPFEDQNINLLQIPFDDDYGTISGYRKVKKVEDDENEVSGYGWLGTSNDNQFIHPSNIGIILLNKLISQANSNIFVVSRDANVFHKLLEEIAGIRYMWPLKETPKPIYAPTTKKAYLHSMKDLSNKSILKRISMFSYLDEYVREIGEIENGNLLLILNLIMVRDLSYWKTNRSSQTKEGLREDIERFGVTEEEWKSFINVVNFGRKNVFHYDENKIEVIMRVIDEIRKRKLSNEPWKRITIESGIGFNGSGAFYNVPKQKYDAIIIYGRPDIFTQAVRIVANGNDIETYSTKTKAIVYKTKEKEIYRNYFKLLNYFSNLLTKGPTYIADPQYIYGSAKYQQLLTNEISERTQ